MSSGSSPSPPQINKNKYHEPELPLRDDLPPLEGIHTIQTEKYENF